MTPLLHFESTRLANRGKKGVLTPDEHGYYSMPVGALNTYNSAKEFYVGSRDVVALFEKDSLLQRRIAGGYVKAEEGHPKFMPGMSVDDYIDRLYMIEETRVCAHFRKISLDFTFGSRFPEYNCPNMIGVIGEFCPSGPYGDALKKSMDNPHENVAFSLRSFTDDYDNHGRVERYITQVINYDRVTEPGVFTSNKWDSAALESADRVTMTVDALRRKIQKQHPGAGNEDSRRLLKDMYDYLQKRNPGLEARASLKHLQQGKAP